MQMSKKNATRESALLGHQHQNVSQVVSSNDLVGSNPALVQLTARLGAVPRHRSINGFATVAQRD
jgi:hypothetical protein